MQLNDFKYHFLSLIEILFYIYIWHGQPQILYNQYIVQLPTQISWVVFFLWLPVVYLWCVSDCMPSKRHCSGTDQHISSANIHTHTHERDRVFLDTSIFPAFLSVFHLHIYIHMNPTSVSSLASHFLFLYHGVNICAQYIQSFVLQQTS